MEKAQMKSTMIIAAVAASGILLGPALAAEAVPQTVQLAKVDVTSVSAGYRASTIIGSSVVNDAGESIGSVDDLLVSPDGKETYAVLSVGGFLGIGSKLVVVPYSSLKPGEKIVLPGGTKDGLTA
ncbi:MAG: PRC-barrel domain-containing protein, partial [Variovorax sp.]